MKKFTTYLNDYLFHEVVPLWNEYASENDMDAYIYDSVEDFSDATDTEGVELARMVFFGDVKNWLDNVYIDGYGNFKSCWSVESSPIDIELLANWMKDTGHQEYNTWLESIEFEDFSVWLAGELTNETLADLWEEYIGGSDDIADNGLPFDFDIADLARELMSDWHNTFKDFVESHI